MNGKNMAFMKNSCREPFKYILVFPTGTPGRSTLHEVMQETLGSETDKGGSQYKMHSGAGYCCGRPLENG